MLPLPDKMKIIVFLLMCLEKVKCDLETNLSADAEPDNGKFFVFAPITLMLQY